MAFSQYVRFGITSIVEPGVSPAVCRAYQNLYARGTLLLRVNLMPNWHGFSLHQETEVLHRLVEEMGVYTGFGDQWLRLGPLKLVFDGGLTSRTAWLSWPYVDEAALRASIPLRLDLERLDGWVKTAHDRGWSVGIHVVGDSSQDRAVDAMYRAHK